MTQSQPDDTILLDAIKLFPVFSDDGAFLDPFYYDKNFIIIQVSLSLGRHDVIIIFRQQNPMYELAGCRISRDNRRLLAFTPGKEKFHVIHTVIPFLLLRSVALQAMLAHNRFHFLCKQALALISTSQVE